jgi:hypothetical protein
MKSLMISIALLASISIFAESKCGRVTGMVWNHHDHPTQGISGFWVKQATTDIRVTRGMNNEDLMILLEGLDTRTGLFICLDDYQITPKPWSGRTRLYAEVFDYRLWQKGERIK